MMGRNLTWLCKMVGSSQGRLEWTLPHGQRLGEGECWSDRCPLLLILFPSSSSFSPSSSSSSSSSSHRACVKEGRLSLSFLHPEDVGDYTCTASNIHGNNSRSVYLEVQVTRGGGPGTPSSSLLTPSPRC